MFGPKDRNKRQTPPEPAAEPGAEPKKGGFGAFADKYRARWEAEHPNAGKSDQQRTVTPESTPADPNPSDSADRPAKP